jgi:hypothetical protein
MEPRTAPPGSFFHKRHQKFSQGRLRTEILTLEEAAWLVIGISFGWFAARGASVILILLPLILFIAWAYEQWYAAKHGLRYIHNVPARRR